MQDKTTGRQREEEEEEEDCVKALILSNEHNKASLGFQVNFVRWKREEKPHPLLDWSRSPSPKLLRSSIAVSPVRSLLPLPSLHSPQWITAANLSLFHCDITTEVPRRQHSPSASGGSSVALSAVGPAAVMPRASLAFESS